MGQHRRFSIVVAVLCAVLVLAMGTAQALHSHPDNSAHHTCSICSVPNVTLNTADVSPVPVMLAVPLASIETSSPQIFRPAAANYVRPPPVA